MMSLRFSQFLWNIIFPKFLGNALLENLIFPRHVVLQDHKVHYCMVHDLHQKNPILGLFLGIIPKMRFFPKNLSLSDFYPLVSQTSSEISEKSYEKFRRKRIYLLTYWKWWNHKTPFCLKVGVQKKHAWLFLFFKTLLPFISHSQNSHILVSVSMINVTWHAYISIIISFF